MFPSTIAVSTLRKNLKSTFDTITVTRSPYIITRKGKENIIILPADEYTAMLETLHLVKSPKNAEKLKKSLEEESDGNLLYNQLLS